MDKSREQFEMWMMSSGKTNFSKIDDIYASSDTFFMWQAWQASREALVVQLPKAFDSAKEDASHYEYAYLKSEVEESLDAAGVSYK